MYLFIESCGAMGTTLLLCVSSIPRCYLWWAGMFKTQLLFVLRLLNTIRISFTGLEYNLLLL